MKAPNSHRRPARPAKPSARAAPAPGPILVVSDFHMTSGRDPDREVWSPTEDFFWDEEFRDFLREYGSRGGCTLVINGDMFDFLQVLALPSAAEASLYGIPRGDVSEIYGLKTSEAAAAFQIDRIIDGHPVAFGAMAEFLRKNRIVVIKGNHDIQLFWLSVQRQLRQRIAEFLPASSRGCVETHLTFVPWFHYVPGLLYVEHGNQYEAATSFQHFLNPILPFKTPDGADHIELDLGSLVIRYFSNRMEVMHLLSDNMRPLSEYLRRFLQNHPLVFASTLGNAVRYLLNALGKARRLSRGRTRAAYAAIGRRHRELLEAEAKARASAPGEVRRLLEALRARDARKARPALSRGPVAFLWGSLRGPILTLGWLAPLALVAGVPSVSRAIRGALGGGGGLPESPVIEIAAVALIVWLTALLRRSVLRRRAARRHLEDPVLRLREEAREIARDLGVKIVAFGHTHQEDALRLAQGRWYYNTGTWITVYAESENLFRLPRQFTFLKIEGGEPSLLHWDPASRSARPAIVVDPEAAHAPPEPKFSTLVRKALRIRSLKSSFPGMNRRFEQFLERLTRRKG